MFIACLASCGFDSFGFENCTEWGVFSSFAYPKKLRDVGVHASNHDQHFDGQEPAHNDQ